MRGAAAPCFFIRARRAAFLSCYVSALLRSMRRWTRVWGIDARGTHWCAARTAPGDNCATGMTCHKPAGTAASAAACMPTCFQALAQLSTVCWRLPDRPATMGRGPNSTGDYTGNPASEWSRCQTFGQQQQRLLLYAASATGHAAGQRLLRAGQPARCCQGHRHRPAPQQMRAAVPAGLQRPARPPATRGHHNAAQQQPPCLTAYTPHCIHAYSTTHRTKQRR